MSKSQQPQRRASSNRITIAFIIRSSSINRGGRECGEEWKVGRSGKWGGEESGEEGKEWRSRCEVAARDGSVCHCFLFIRFRCSYRSTQLITFFWHQPHLHLPPPPPPSIPLPFPSFYEVASYVADNGGGGHDGRCERMTRGGGGEKGRREREREEGRKGEKEGGREGQERAISELWL